MNTKTHTGAGGFAAKIKGAIGRTLKTRAALEAEAQAQLKRELATSSLAPEVGLALLSTVRHPDDVQPRLRHARAVSDLTRAAFPKDMAIRNARAGKLVEAYTPLPVVRSALINETAAQEADEICTAHPTAVPGARGSVRLDPGAIYARRNAKKEEPS